MRVLLPSRSELLVLVKDAAALHGLDWKLVAAVVEQESNFDPWAMRYEPAFCKRYIEPLNLSDTEKIARSTSFGLLQLMGASARALNFRGWLTMLCDPETNLNLGCQWLVRKIALHGGDVRAGLLAWNGGGVPSYPDQVMGRMGNFA